MSNSDITQLIQSLVDKETQAWDTQDADKLVSIFHPDMVWPWPMTSDKHDPMQWCLEQGRFNEERWKNNWKTLFDSHLLVHNNRSTKKIVVSSEGDGAFAVVDVDTLWRHKVSNNEFHWKGRACKVYTKTSKGWFLIAHTGLLDYASS